MEITLCFMLSFSIMVNKEVYKSEELIPRFVINNLTSCRTSDFATTHVVVSVRHPITY